MLYFVSGRFLKSIFFVFYFWFVLFFRIGVPWHDAAIAGQMIGTKLAINEFVGYLEFAPYLATDAACHGTPIGKREAQKGGFPNVEILD